jgi:hypothetical protein
LPVKNTWLTKLKFDLEFGALTETQSVIDYRNTLEAISDDADYEDINWPEYPSA